VTKAEAKRTSSTATLVRLAGMGTSRRSAIVEVSRADQASVVDALLSRLLTRHGGRQIFLFGPAGEPFWAAHLPVAERDLDLLDRGLALLAQLEASRPKPFFAHDRERRLVVAALDGAEDLYVVVLQEALDPEPAELRAALIRRDAAPDLLPLREEIHRLTTARRG
jgi:hypothetical protein